VADGCCVVPRCVHELDLLQIVQAAELVVAFLAALLAPRAGPSTRFDCCWFFVAEGTVLTDEKAAGP